MKIAIRTSHDYNLAPRNLQCQKRNFLHKTLSELRQEERLPRTDWTCRNRAAGDMAHHVQSEGAFQWMPDRVNWCKEANKKAGECSWRGFERWQSLRWNLQGLLPGARWQLHPHLAHLSQGLSTRLKHVLLTANNTLLFKNSDVFMQLWSLFPIR